MYSIYAASFREASFFLQSIVDKESLCVLNIAVMLQ